MEDRRRHRRISAEGVYGNIFLTYNAEVVNISLGGAAVRLGRCIMPGKEYILKLDEQGMKLELKCVAVWSDHEKQKDSPGAGQLCEAGLRFDNIFTGRSSELLKIVEAYNKEKGNDRLRVATRVRMSGPKKAVLYEAFVYRVKDVSPYGMRIETVQPAKPEDRFPMEMFLKDVFPFKLDLGDVHIDEFPMDILFQGAAVNFSGKIVACAEIRDTDPARYDMEVEFLEMNAEDWASLEKFLDSLSPGKA